jgi:hypothetical protein
VSQPLGERSCPAIAKPIEPARTHGDGRLSGWPQLDQRIKTGVCVCMLREVIARGLLSRPKLSWAKTGADTTFFVRACT